MTKNESVLPNQSTERDKVNRNFQPETVVLRDRLQCRCPKTCSLETTQGDPSGGMSREQQARLCVTNGVQFNINHLQAGQGIRYFRLVGMHVLRNI